MSGIFLLVMDNNSELSGEKSGEISCWDRTEQ